MVAKSPLWKYFYTDKSKYKTDKTHYNAWCSACLDEEIRAMKFAHAAALARGEHPETPDDNSWFERGARTFQVFSQNTVLIKLKQLLPRLSLFAERLEI